jgi:hypothetical protein
LGRRKRRDVSFDTTQDPNKIKKMRTHMMRTSHLLHDVSSQKGKVERKKNTHSIVYHISSRGEWAYIPNIIIFFRLKKKQTMVAGEVDTTDAVLHNVRGFPTEKKLAEKVLALPEQVRGKTLIPATASGDLAPCTEAGKVIKASITHGRFQLGKLMTMKDNYSLSDAAGEPLAGGVHIVEFESLNALTTGARLVLKDHKEKPVSAVLLYDFRFRSELRTAIYIGHFSPPKLPPLPSLIPSLCTF